MRLSVVIPAFNEEGNIGRLIEETYAAVPETMLGEVIVVDDASDDGTGAEIKALIPRYGSLRYMKHGRRAGQSAALRTAVLAARVPAIAAMDGDGQNDPHDIAGLFGRLGAPGKEPALVGGLRASRKDTGPKRLASRFANWLRDKVLDDGCPDTNSTRCDDRDGNGQHRGRMRAGVRKQAELRRIRCRSRRPRA